MRLCCASLGIPPLLPLLQPALSLGRPSAQGPPCRQCTSRAGQHCVTHLRLSVCPLPLQPFDVVGFQVQPIYLVAVLIALAFFGARGALLAALVCIIAVSQP